MGAYKAELLIESFRLAQAVHPEAAYQLHRQHAVQLDWDGRLSGDSLPWPRSTSTGTRGEADPGLVREALHERVVAGMPLTQRWRWSGAPAGLLHLSGVCSQ